MTTIRFVYVYCSRLGLHGNWIRYYPQIQGVFNDSLSLAERIKQNLEQIHQPQTTENSTSMKRPRRMVSTVKDSSQDNV
jgi:hypothetical protein